MVLFNQKLFILFHSNLITITPDNFFYQLSLIFINQKIHSAAALLQKYIIKTLSPIAIMYR